MNSYVYVYSDPRTSLPVYIGKGTGKRAEAHLKKSHNVRLHNLIKKCQRQGLDIVPTKMCTGLSPAAAKAVETFWIKVFDAGSTLFNVDKCNNLPFEPWNKGTRGKQTSPWKGKKLPAEICAKISATKMGKPGQKGRKNSPESFAKMVETRNKDGKFSFTMSNEGRERIRKSWETRRQKYGANGRRKHMDISTTSTDLLQGQPVASA